MVLFGGANPKNTQVAKGGCGVHAISGWIERAGPRRRRRSSMSARSATTGRRAVAPEWIAIRPEHRHGDDAGAGRTRSSPKGCTTRRSSRATASGSSACGPISWARATASRRMPTGRRAITGVPADTIRALARRMAADAHHGHRVLVAAARRSWRAALLGADPAGRGARPDRPAGRRLRFRLWLGGRHRRAAARLSARRRWRRCAIRPASPSRRRASPIACCIPASATTTTASSGTYPDIRLVYWAGGNPFHHHQELNRLRRAWQRPETDHRARAVVDGDRAPRRHRAAGDDLARAQRYRLRARATATSWRCTGDRAGRRGARAIFASSRDLARRLGCEAAYTEGRDEMAWLRHIYDGWRERRAHQPGGDAGFRRVLGRGLARDPAQGRGIRAVRPISAPIPEKHKLGTPSGRIELYSERIAGFGYDDCPPHPTWLEPAEWLGGAAARPIRCISSRASRATGCTARWMPGPVSARGKVAGREAVAINPADAARRAASPTAMWCACSTRAAPASPARW